MHKETTAVGLGYTALLEQKIASLKQWLVDHPTGDWEARYDKISELAQLERELKTIKNK